MFLLLLTSPLNLDCLKFNSQSSLFLTYHLLISNINPTSYLYLSLNSSSSSSQKKNLLPAKQIANVSPINDFTTKSQFPQIQRSILFLSLFLTYHLLILWFVLDFFYDVVIQQVFCFVFFFFTFQFLVFFFIFIFTIFLYIIAF